jgi:hypothetical protein
MNDEVLLVAAVAHGSATATAAAALAAVTLGALAGEVSGPVAAVADGARGTAAAAEAAAEAAATAVATISVRTLTGDVARPGHSVPTPHNEHRSVETVSISQVESNKLFDSI